jgi:dolichol-phosphate mannosyltransferase
VDDSTHTSSASAADSRSDRVVRWVAPAYNEAASIEDLIDRIAEVSAEQGWRYEILIVDDGSKDATGDLSRAKAPAIPVTVVRNEPNKGLGRTIRRGLRTAAEASGPDDVVVTLDADLTQDPGYAPAMLARLDEGADVVIASRYRRGSSVEGLSQFRTMLSYGASGLVALIRPVRGVRDYSCGFRVYRSQTLREAFERDGDDFVSETGFGCMVEIAERLRGYADFAEVPFVLRYDAKRKESAIKILPTIGAYFRVIAKVAVAHREQVPMGSLALALVAVVLASVGQLLLGVGTNAIGPDAFAATINSAFSQWQVLLGLGLYGVSALAWLAVLSRLELTVAYPLGAASYVLVVGVAWLSGEHVPPMRWFGVLLIVLGMALVTWLGVSPRKAVRA